MAPLVLDEGSHHRAELTDLATLLRAATPPASWAPVNARPVVSGLTEYGVLVSESSRAPLRLAFPAVLASRWMPGLFPEKGV